jgi:5-methylthioadenosine/S-adenosylhomocysteine deaminase
MTATLLVRGGLVVTMDPARGILETNVLVEGGRIAECPSDRVEADVVVDASGGLVIPGLIQTHVHLCQTLFRGMADDMDVIDWLRLRIWPFEQAHDERSIYDSARLAIAEMLLGGTTTALTIETVRYTEEAFRAILETGFRAVSGKAMMDRFEVGTEMVGERTDESLAESLRLLAEFHGAGDGRLRYAFCPRGSRNATEGLWRDVAAAAEEHDAWIHTHAAENEAQTERLAAEGGTDVAYLAGLGALGPRIVLAHCIWLTDDERRLLAETGANVAHCPTCNMKLASGFAPVPELLEGGVTVGLGADGAPCNNTLDMFQEMRMASLIHKPRRGPRAMPADRVFEMATLGGARSIGMESELGSLEAGKRADLVVLRRDRLHLQPQESVDTYAQLVYEHRASDVDTVVVDGRILVRDGALVELDEGEIRGRANESASRVLERVAAGGRP